MNQLTLKSFLRQTDNSDHHHSDSEEHGLVIGTHDPAPPANKQKKL